MYNIKILSTNQGKDILYTEINLPSNYLWDLLVIYFASKNTLLLNLILLHLRLYEEKRMWTFLSKTYVKKPEYLEVLQTELSTLLKENKILWNQLSCVFETLLKNFLHVQELLCFFD